METNEHLKMAKDTGIVMVITFLSRIFGFIRDAFIAWSFGAGFKSDIFFVAFRIPNLIRKLFSEGVLSLSFIPIFIEYLSTKGKKEAFQLARSAFLSSFLILAVVTIAGIFFTPLLVTVLAPGFVSSPEKFALTVSLTRIMLPFIIFIGLSAICMGILNTFGHFTTPALSPFIINISMISAILIISPQMAEPVKGLAIGALLGGILQLLLQGAFLVKTGIFLREKTVLFHRGLKRVGLLTLPAALGASVFPINALLDSLIASFLVEGSISHLYYADRLVQFPLGIFGIAAATVLLPGLTKEASLKNYQALAETMTMSLKMVLFITVPAMAGLIVLREPIISLLFERGAFESQNVRLTAEALLYYGVGLWAFASVRIIVSTFYALQDNYTPARIALVCILLKIIMAVVFIRFSAFKGLALSTSVASVLNLAFLLHALQFKLGYIDLKDIGSSLIRTLAGAFLMSLGVVLCSRVMLLTANNSIFAKSTGLFGCILVGIILYGIFSLLFNGREISILSEAIKRIRRAKK